MNVHRIYAERMKKEAEKYAEIEYAARYLGRTEWADKARKEKERLRKMSENAEKMAVEEDTLARRRADFIKWPRTLRNSL